MRILVTGGTGYIGSHTSIQLLQAGYEVTIVDNLSNSKIEVISRIQKLSGKKPKFYSLDIRDKDALDEVFGKEEIEAVIHFAGFKAVGESVAKPIEYYKNNVCGTLVLCERMKKHGIKNMVFSSSATVYGDPKTVPIHENFPLSTTNPYGASKWMIEQILKDIHQSDKTWNISILRYFNPAGAHISGIIGEDPMGVPNNLIPYITQVAIGKLDKLEIFGGDYETADKTGVRDYIHIEDLAAGHLAALKKLRENPGYMVHNLGTGTGYSVLQMVKVFEKVTNCKIPYVITKRRPGDIAVCYADTSKAYAELGWTTEKTLEDMCQDAWRWQSKNPNGYDD